MMKIRFGLGVFLFLILTNIYAAVDPISWSLSPASGFPTVFTGEVAAVTYTFSVHPKFPAPVSISLNIQFSGSIEGFTITNGCKNQLIRPGAFCTVLISYVPVDISEKTIQLSYQYNDNVIPLPQLSVTGAGQRPQLVVGTISGLPDTITLNPVQQPSFTVTYTNTGGADVTGFAGDAAGQNLLSTTPISNATVSVVPASNTCGTSDNPTVIRPGDFCTIQGQINPVNIGDVLVSGLFTYNNNRATANPSQKTSIISSGSCVTAAATLKFQDSTFQYADNILEFTYTNSCDVRATLGDVSFTASGTSTNPTILGAPYNQAYDQCSNTTLAGHSSCSVLVSVIPQTAGTLTVTASATSGSPVTASSATQVQVPQYNHNVTFVNQCPFPVWYGVTTPVGSSDPTLNPSPAAYLLPAQAIGAAPSTKTITFGANSYNGIMLPRTGCTLTADAFICKTGDCNSGKNGQCSATAYEPFTRIEEVFYTPTFVPQGNYDIALEDGTNIPVEFKGLGPSSNQYTNPAASFVCSGAGAPIPIPFDKPPYMNGISLGACPWTYAVPTTPANSSALYNFVSNDTQVNDCSQCSSGTCGLAYQTTPENQNVVLACGQLLGFWSLTTLGTVHYVGNPAYDPNTVFQFDKKLTKINGFQSGYPPGASAYDLYACQPQGSTLQTCYPSTESTLCCGAQNWNQFGSYGAYLTAQASNATDGVNPDWLNAGTLPISPYDSILWLKQACPTGYSYPFDDPSSSFNCNYSDAEQSTAVAMDFEVVFCPGGLYSNLSKEP